MTAVMQSGEVHAFGESKNAFQWARDSRCRVTYPALLMRLKSGMAPEFAITSGRKKPPHVIEAGQRFGCLLASSDSRIASKPDGSSWTIVDCVCDCGKQVTKSAMYLTRAEHPSCGCGNKTRGRKRVRTDDERKEIKKKWRIKNRVVRRMYIKAWKERNRGLVASYQYAREQIKQWSESDRDSVNQIYNASASDEVFTCYLCGVDTHKRGRHVDHRKPLARGGFHIADNLAIACESCNLRKGSMTEQEFRDKCLLSTNSA